MKIAVECTYHCSTTSVVDLPEGVTLDQIDSMYVKWGTLHVSLKDGREVEVNASNDSPEIDWKRPQSATAYSIDAEGYIEYENDISAECGLIGYQH